MVFIALASCLSRLVHAAGNEIRLEDMANLNLIENGGGAPRKDRATSDHPLQMGGRIYEHGLGLHAPAVAMFSLDGKTEKFHTLLGFSDFPGDRGSIEFILTGDGKVLYRSGVMKGGLYKNGAVTIAAEAPKVVDVSLLGVKKLKIEVTDGGDNKYGDHVNLVDAAFTWNGTQPRIVDVEEYVGHSFPPVGGDKAKSPENGSDLKRLRQIRGFVTARVSRWTGSPLRFPHVSLWIQNTGCGSMVS